MNPVADPPSAQPGKIGGGTDTAALSAERLADERLEMAIESTRLALLGAHTRSMKVELAEQMKRLIGQRSPGQIARMEREKFGRTMTE